MTNLKQLSQRTVSPQEADSFIRAVLNEPELTEENVQGSKMFQTVNSLYQGKGMGSELSSASGTAWGLVNAMTEYVDHHRRARNQDNRLDSAWFGQGAILKQKAFNQALALIH